MKSTDPSFQENEAITMLGPMPLVSIIIVGHNSLSDIGSCLSSVFSLDYPNYEVIYVDSGSTDGSAEYLSGNFEKVRVIVSEMNLGYGKACNLAARSSNGQFLAFLNADIRVDKRWLTEIIDVMLKGQNIGACGGEILFWNGDRIQSLGGAYNPETGYALDLAFGKETNEAARRPNLVWTFHCCGAALLVRREAFEMIEGFDEEYFLYYDDVDLCWRIRMAGYEVCSVMSSVAYHKMTLERAHSSRYRRFVERNSLFTMIKNYEMKSILRCFPLCVFIRSTAFVILLLRGRKEYALPILAGFFDLLRDFRCIYEKRERVISMRKRGDGLVLQPSLLVSFPILLRMFFAEIYPVIQYRKHVGPKSENGECRKPFDSVYL